MRCFGTKQDGVLCDMCNRISYEYFKNCKDTYSEKFKLNQELNTIKTNCKFFDQDWDEYTLFDSCAKNSEIRKNSDVCRPTLDCAKYSK